MDRLLRLPVARRCYALGMVSGILLLYLNVY